MTKTHLISNDIYHFYRKLEKFHGVEASTGGGSKDRSNWSVLLGLDEHIRFVSEAADRAQLGKENCREFLDRVKRVNARCTDPSLYVAIVGEFGSGKSTFINTLLRDDILKTSFKVATAAETQIRHNSKRDAKVEFHNRPPIRLRFKNDSVEELMAQLFSPDRSNLKKLSSPKRRDRFEKDLTDFIHQHTECGELAESVSRFTLYHPSEFLADGLVLIDTPGLNSRVPGHAEITRRTIQEVADIALVLINADRPISETLKSFLTGQFKDHLDRCIFIITQIDKIPEEEQEDQQSYIHDRLMAELGYTPPDHLQVYACSSSSAFDYLKSDSDEHPGRIWADRFLELEKKIRQTLLEQRTGSRIARVKLIEQLLINLRQHLEDRAEAHQREVGAISQFFSDLPAFSQNQIKDCQGIIERQGDRASTEMDELLSIHCRQLQEKATEAIGQSLLSDNLRNVLGQLKNDAGADIKSVSDDIFSGALDKINNTRTESLDLIHRRIKDEINRLEQNFDFEAPGHLECKLHRPMLDDRITFEKSDKFIKEKLPGKSMADNWRDFARDIFGGLEKLKVGFEHRVHADIKQIYKILKTNLHNWFAEEGKRILKPITDYNQECIDEAAKKLRLCKEARLALIAEIKSDLEELGKRLDRIQRLVGENLNLTEKEEK